MVIMHRKFMFDKTDFSKKKTNHTSYKAQLVQK